MRWRDIRFEEPTEADGDGEGFVLQLLGDGGVCRSRWDELRYVVAWMPLSELPEFDPVPDPPEGWRFATTEDEFDSRAMYWSDNNNDWTKTRQLQGYEPSFDYIVPVDPPKPKYRPYTETEAVDLIGKVVLGIAGYRAMITGVSYDKVYCQGLVITLEKLLSDHTFVDGSKCGVEVADED